MITLHSFKTPDGREIPYVRVRRWMGRTLVAQSVLLHRLTLAQRRQIDD